MGELSQIVDEQDNIIGAKPREEIDSQIDYYRTSGLWLTNLQGQVLIAQRLLTKPNDPGKWGPAVSGTLEAGETYESSVYKEAAEEIGLVNVSFTLGPKIKYEKPRKCFGQWFFAVCDWPEEKFTPQPTEVGRAKWIDKDELFQDIGSNPDKYISTMPLIIKVLYPA